MQEVLKYIHNNIHLPLSAGNVAKHYGYSIWHFCEKFKLYTGRNFIEYVRHYRLNLAALEILSGIKILDVATAFGYESIGGFNKAFLKNLVVPLRNTKNRQLPVSYITRKGEFLCFPYPTDAQN